MQILSTYGIFSDSTYNNIMLKLEADHLDHV